VRVGALLSLTGRFARFGRQAAAGLEAWRRLSGAELAIEDDGSDPARVAAGIAELAARCDVLLGPYSTRLTRAAALALADTDRVLWNHGGAGDDVQRLLPGRMVSVLAPAGRYAEPFLRRAARAPLVIAAGRGAFGQQVAAGAEALAGELGLEVAASPPDGEWDLLSAGVFEDDVAAVRQALALPRPPRAVWSVAAGVRDFGGVEGVYGPAQWFPGSGAPVELGPDEADFLAACGGTVPDYPAVQAAAAAVLGTHCAATGVAPSALDTTTLFGRFRVDGRGVQVGHETVLLRWSAGELAAVR
jgi:hypothetical protein